MPSLKELALTQERLKHLLHYNPDNGVFIWRNKPASRSNRIKAGDIAGCIKTDSGYVVINIDGKSYRAHRLAWFYVYGVWPKQKIDHINNIKSDNRILNLREASNSENGWNIGAPATNTSGVKGVCWDKQTRKWRAQCWVSGKHYVLGRFASIDEAAMVVARFREKHHGEFCNHG